VDVLRNFEIKKILRLQRILAKFIHPPQMSSSPIR
jgi:hypothetical protein